MNNLCNTKPELLKAVQTLEQAALDKHNAFNDGLYADLLSSTEIVSTLLYTLNGCTSTKYMNVYIGSKREIHLDDLFQYVNKHSDVKLTFDHQKHPDFTEWFNNITKDVLGITYRKKCGSLFGEYVMYWEDETFKEYMYYHYWCYIRFDSLATWMILLFATMFFFVTIPLAILLICGGIYDDRKYIAWGSKRKDIRKTYGC